LRIFGRAPMPLASRLSRFAQDDPGLRLRMPGVYRQGEAGEQWLKDRGRWCFIGKDPSMLGVSTVSTIKTMGGCDKVMSWWLVRVFSSFYIIYIFIFYRYCYYYYYLVSSLSLFISIIILIRLQGCFRRSQNRWFVRTPIPQMLGLHPKWGEIWIQCFSCKKKLLDSAKESQLGSVHKDIEVPRHVLMCSCVSQTSWNVALGCWYC
jgi:hypothetical protein